METIEKIQMSGVAFGFCKRWRIATGIVLVFFLVSLSGVIFPPLETWSAQFANRNYNGEGLIEILEAVFWLSASCLYIFLLIATVKQEKWGVTSFWLLFFSLFCFVAFGEEISWGQHIFNFEPTEAVVVYNKQKEFNIHNLNIGKIFNWGTDFNLTALLNPVFYATCVMFWVIIPLLKRAGRLGRNRLMSSLPAPSYATVVFLIVTTCGYLIIDKLFFDVGEIFELSLALTALMVPLDILFQDSIQPVRPSGSA